jgi:hypothetical protein
MPMLTVDAYDASGGFSGALLAGLSNGDHA